MTSKGETDLILKAISFAARKHIGQFRKDNETPYISHTFRVAMILSQVFGVKDERILAAAVLHDTIEDTTTDYDDIEKEFGKEIAVWVGMLSKDKRKQEKEREEAYLKVLAQAPDEVKLIKLADVYDNSIDAGTLSDKMAFEKTRMRAKQYLEAFSLKESELVSRALGSVKEIVYKNGAV